MHACGPGKGVQVRGIPVNDVAYLVNPCKNKVINKIQRDGAETIVIEGVNLKKGQAAFVEGIYMDPQCRGLTDSYVESIKANLLYDDFEEYNVEYKYKKEAMGKSFFLVGHGGPDYYNKKFVANITLTNVVYSKGEESYRCFPTFLIVKFSMFL